MAETDDVETDRDQRSEKKCLYCKATIGDTIFRCYKCEKVCHKSCTTREKNLKTITAEINRVVLFWCG